MRLISLLVAASLFSAGCSTMEYEGSSPPAQTMGNDQDGLGVSNGPNLTFALDRPSDYHASSPVQSDTSALQADTSADAGTK